jgi:hypothetical protein
MDIIKLIFEKVNPNVVIFLLTSLIAFISWIIKGLIEKPINESKTTFNKFLEKRIEILFEIKAKLDCIAYFPRGKDSEKFKEQLQDLLLKDGRACHLNQNDFDNVLKISITPETNEKLLLETIKSLDEDLFSQISKIRDEITFYKKFSNYNPFKRFIGITLLVLQYILSFVIILSSFFFVVYGLITFNIYFKILIIIVISGLIYLITKWLNK